MTPGQFLLNTPFYFFRRNRTGQDIHRLHIKVETEFRKRNKLVRVSNQSDTLTVKILMVVAYHIAQSAALVSDSFRYRYACDFAQSINKPVCCR